MNIIALIPARMQSTRFPGKPLAPILGKPMIGHVYDRVRKNPLLSNVVVATCNNEIVDYIERMGGEAVMTGEHHERASDRCSEALHKIEKSSGVTFDIVVMVQGDEPLTDPEMISEALKPLLEDPSVLVSNLLGKISTKEEFEDRNCIKVVCDRRGDALYFSREPIPTRAKSKHIPMGKQVCIIPFRRDFLLKYNSLPPTPLEIAESVDMMRVLEHGFNVRMVPTRFETHAIDTPEDLKQVEEIMSKQNR